MRNSSEKEKGIVLLMVIGLVLVVFVGIIGLLFVLEARRRNLEAFKERARAYYLCELGASVAILDIGRGKIGSKPDQWTERTFDYLIPEENRTYEINYAITRPAGQWQIISSVGPPGFHRTYKLRVGGRRAFPYFIRGFGGK
jgi:hypothetical protein